MINKANVLTTKNDQLVKREVNGLQRNTGQSQEVGNFLFTLLLWKQRIEIVNPSTDY